MADESHSARVRAGPASLNFRANSGRSTLIVGPGGRGYGAGHLPAGPAVLERTRGGGGGLAPCRFPFPRPLQPAGDEQRVGPSVGPVSAGLDGGSPAPRHAPPLASGWAGDGLKRIFLHGLPSPTADADRAGRLLFPFRPGGRATTGPASGGGGGSGPGGKPASANLLQRKPRDFHGAGSHAGHPAKRLAGSDGRRGRPERARYSRGAGVAGSPGLQLYAGHRRQL